MTSNPSQLLGVNKMSTVPGDDGVADKKLSDALSAIDEAPYEKELLEMLMGQGEPYETEPLRPIVSSHVMLVGVAETEKEIGEVAASSDAVNEIDELP